MKKVICILAIAIIAVACEKKTNSVQPVQTSNNKIKQSDAKALSITAVGNDIYIAGYHGLAAVYWKNGIKYKLTDSTKQAIANSIFIKDTNIYVAGHEGNIAKYWLNGKEVKLSGTKSEAYSICVTNGSRVHVVGYANYDGSKDIARYWRNGVTYELGDSLANNSYARSVGAFNSTIHIIVDAGYESYYMKSFKKYKVFDSFKSLPVFTGMYMKDSTAYITGQSYDFKAVYWKMEHPEDTVKPTTVSTSGRLIALTSNGNDVYSTGYVYPLQYSNIINYKYFVNGNVNSITEPNTISRTTGIAVLNSDVYLSGYTYNSKTLYYEAVYWKNGEIFYLTGGL